MKPSARAMPRDVRMRLKEVVKGRETPGDGDRGTGSRRGDKGRMVEEGSRWTGFWSSG